MNTQLVGNGLAGSVVCEHDQHGPHQACTCHTPCDSSGSQYCAEHVQEMKVNNLLVYGEVIVQKELPYFFFLRVKNKPHGKMQIVCYS